jgi:hypothetical protein
MHPTVKPTALVIDDQDCSRRGTSSRRLFWLGHDDHGGAEVRRRARAIELDPLYVDVAIRRWQTFTGQMATMAVTGESFEDVEQRRRDPLQ